ncbi:carboxylesterase [Geopyxis carbonaria]|nr:carboxylesterase [Geopyxis carbonaria]
MWLTIPHITDVSCYVLVLSGFLLGKPALCSSDIPTVATAAGVVRGAFDTEGNYVWKGIPYAASTAGANRWKAPQPISWKGPLNATAYGPTCPQAYRSDFQFTAPSEDCLNLNIWAPSSGKNHAVLVYIYGGAMVTGSNSNPGLQGTHFASRDVVYVNLNHRMNVFGFPNSASAKGEQNYGILDVEAALEWVHDNIKQFGGDPDRIVLAGHSSGSVMVDHYLWNHPSTFLAGAMQMSANANSGPAVAPAGVGLAALAAEHGCSTTDPLPCLRALPAATLATSAFNSTYNTWFAPSLSPATRKSPATFATAPRPRIPLLVGSAAAEGFVFQFVYGAIATPLSSWIRTFDADVAHIPAAANLTSHYPNTAAGAGEMYGDARFSCPTEHLVNLRAAGQKVWQYRWLGAGAPASHGSEVPFWHGGGVNFADAGVAASADMQTAADSMVGALVKFVKAPAQGPGWEQTSAGEEGALALLGGETPGEVGAAQRGDYNGICKELYEPYMEDYPVLVDPSA